MLESKFQQQNCNVESTIWEYFDERSRKTEKNHYSKSEAILLESMIYA